MEVQILDEGFGGILGFGAKPARVKLVEKRWTAETSGTNHSGAPKSQARSNGPAPRRSGDYPPAERSFTRDEENRAPRKKEPRISAHHSQKKPAPARRHERPAGTKPPSLTSAQTEAACRKAEDLLKEILSLMLFEDARLEARWDAEQERVKVSIETADFKRLIGAEGKTLESLQLLATLIVGRRLGGPIAVQVDTQSYWETREKAILAEARKAADTVRATGKPFRLAPMDAQMRRLIHRSLADHPDIVTSSEGDGAWRKIVLRPSK